MVRNDRKVLPAVATHPGRILKKELQARGIKQAEFAKAIGIPAPNLSELINGKRNLTPSLAIKLEDALGIPYQNWMSLQDRYFYVKLRREEEERRVSDRVAEPALRFSLPTLY